MTEKENAIIIDGKKYKYQQRINNAKRQGGEPMTTKDLMIGDWVYDLNGFPKRVDEIFSDSVALGGVLNHFSSIQPIPITEDTLTKNGFQKGTDTYGVVKCFIRNDDFSSIVIHEINDGSWYISERNMEFADIPQQALVMFWVHELKQFLHHCGVGIEIEL